MGMQEGWATEGFQHAIMFEGTEPDMARLAIEAIGVDQRRGVATPARPVQGTHLSGGQATGKEMATAHGFAGRSFSRGCSRRSRASVAKRSSTRTLLVPVSAAMSRRFASVLAQMRGD
jgi:hypothetical protein